MNGPKQISPFKMCLVGSPLTGKPAIANWIAQKYGLKVVPLDDIIQDIVQNYAALDRETEMQEKVQEEMRLAMDEAAIKSQDMSVRNSQIMGSGIEMNDNTSRRASQISSHTRPSTSGENRIETTSREQKIISSLKPPTSGKEDLGDAPDLALTEGDTVSVDGKKLNSPEISIIKNEPGEFDNAVKAGDEDGFKEKSSDDEVIENIPAPSKPIKLYQKSRTFYSDVL